MFVSPPPASRSRGASLAVLCTGVALLLAIVCLHLMSEVTAMRDEMKMQANYLGACHRRALHVERELEDAEAMLAVSRVVLAQLDNVDEAAVTAVAAQ